MATSPTFDESQMTSLMDGMNGPSSLYVRRAVIERKAAHDLARFAVESVSNSSERLAIRNLASINKLVTPTENDGDVDLEDESLDPAIREEYELIEETKLEVRKARVVHSIRDLATNKSELLTPPLAMALVTVWANTYLNRADPENPTQHRISEVDAGMAMLRAMTKALGKDNDPDGGATTAVVAALERAYGLLGETDLAKLLDDKVLFPKLQEWLLSANSDLAGHAAGIAYAFTAHRGLATEAFLRRGLAEAVEGVLAPSVAAPGLLTAMNTLVRAAGAAPALGPRCVDRGLLLRAARLINHSDLGVRMGALELVRVFAPSLRTEAAVDALCDTGMGQFLVDAGDDILALNDEHAAALWVRAVVAFAGAAGASRLLGAGVQDIMARMHKKFERLSVMLQMR
jgi:hypothetical protein